MLMKTKYLAVGGLDTRFPFVADGDLYPSITTCHGPTENKTAPGQAMAAGLAF